MIQVLIRNVVGISMRCNLLFVNSTEEGKKRAQSIIRPMSPTTFPFNFISSRNESLGNTQTVRVVGRSELWITWYNIHTRVTGEMERWKY